MSRVENTTQTKVPTSVDDVRRVREKLSQETGNDVNRLADRAQELRDKLGLKPTSR